MRLIQLESEIFHLKGILRKIVLRTYCRLAHNNPQPTNVPGSTVCGQCGTWHFIKE